MSAADTLVLGLGNDILADDAIGLRVVRELERTFERERQIDFRETSEMGLALLDFITGYSKVILVDSIQTGRAQVGAIHQFEACALPGLTNRTPHFLGVRETLALGRKLGLLMPKEVRIFAIEVLDPFTLSEEMTPPMLRALPVIVARIARALVPKRGRCVMATSVACP